MTADIGISIGIDAIGRFLSYVRQYYQGSLRNGFGRVQEYRIIMLESSRPSVHAVFIDSRINRAIVTIPIGRSKKAMSEQGPSSPRTRCARNAEAEEVMPKAITNLKKSHSDEETKKKEIEARSF